MTVTFETLPRHFMGAHTSIAEAQWVIVGLPYDGTCSYRPGTRFGPAAVREASWGLETYSPFVDRDLENIRFADAGDLDLPFGNRTEVLLRIKQVTQEILKQSKRWIGVGGEHLVTLPVIEAYLEIYPDLAVVHFDAHADLRDDYLGEKLSHATVMRRIVEQIGPERLAQIGIRSGPKTEFDWMRENRTLMTTPADLTQKLNAWHERPLFVTIDLDILDPSIFPGTGTPEPGGFSFLELQTWLLCLKDRNIVGFDAVELSPPYDASGVSNVVAAKTIREMLLLTPLR
jgi:agmatinase